MNAEKIIIGTLAEELAAKRILVERRYWKNRKCWSLSGCHPEEAYGRLRCVQAVAASEREKNGLKLQKGLIGIIEQAANGINGLDSKMSGSVNSYTPDRYQRRLKWSLRCPGVLSACGCILQSVVSPGQKLMDIVPAGSPS